MPVSYNLTAAAQAIFRDQKCHIVARGDSQTADVANYLFATTFPALLPIRLAGLIAASTNTASTVHSRGLWTATGADFTRFDNVGANDTSTAFNQPNSTGFVVRPANEQQCLRNIANGTIYGTGVVVNKIVSGINWPRTDGNGRPWFHGQNVQYKLVYFDGADSVEGFQLTLRRAGSSANDSTPVTHTTTRDNAIRASVWSGARSDSGTYDAGNNNDHELRCFQTVVADVDETNKWFTPLCAAVCRMSNADTPEDGVYYDSIGRAGFSATEMLARGGTQTAWNQYAAATLVAPTKTVVLFQMIGHNAESVLATEQTGGEFNTTFRDAIRDNILRVKAAYEAAGATVLPVLICPWLFTASANGMTTTAQAASCEARLMELAQEYGWGMFSYYSACNFNAPFSANLHPQSFAEGGHLASLLISELQKAASPVFATRTRNWR